MKEPIATELEALLMRQKELNEERVELEHEMAEWKKKYPILSEYEKKQLAKAERTIAESDKKMLRAQACLKELFFNLKFL